jgi:hypothetical protein
MNKLNQNQKMKSKNLKDAKIKDLSEYLIQNFSSLDKDEQLKAVVYLYYKDLEEKIDKEADYISKKIEVLEQLTRIIEKQAKDKS